MNVPLRLPVFLVALTAFTACSTAFAAEPPRTTVPSVQVEIVDRAAGEAPHVARFDFSVSDGHGEITAYDGTAKYAMKAHVVTTAEPQLALDIKRHEGAAAAAFDVRGAIPRKAGVRVVLARIERGAGGTTTIIAEAR
jgi:hypothetical protein